MIRIDAINPEYDQYGHIVALTIKVRNTGERPLRIWLMASITSKEKGKATGSKGEYTSKESFTIGPHEEKELSLPLNPAVLIPEEGDITIGIGGVIELEKAPAKPEEKKETSN
ncbi:MAG: hypothetical protein DRZ82_00710 [Thermoprotei archaeon]|nr:MAG: hypothetical protein DRZ82_00710 [Thermoprotei archaeon]